MNAARAAMGHMADVIEAIHRLDLEPTPWIDGTCDAVRSFAPWGAGVMGGIGLAERGGRGMEMGVAGGDTGLGDLARRTAHAADAIWSDLLASRTGRMFTIGEALRLRARHPIHATMEIAGLVDLLVVSGTEWEGPSTEYVGFLVGSGAPIDLSTQARDDWNACAAHFASAWRLRRRLSRGEAAAPCEAVLAPSGSCDHAEGAARHALAREALARAVRSIERARTRERRTDDQALLAAWQAVYEGRWTLVEQIDTDGRRQILARVNEPRRLVRSGLSPREQEVAQLLCAGIAQKAIAYELSLSPSTVSFHVHNIASKVGAGSTAEAVHILTSDLGPPP